MPATFRFPWQAPIVTPAERTPSVRASIPIGEDEAIRVALGFPDGQSGGHVSRATAFAIPAIVAARNYLCDVVGCLPVHCTNANGDEVRTPLLEWPESMRGHVRAYTMSMTLEDLWCEGACLWLVVTRDSTGYPTSVERQEWGTWTQDEDGTIHANGREMQPENVILFRTATPPLLTAGANTIRMLRRLELSAKLHNEVPEMLDYIKAEPGRSLPDDDEINAWLNDWQARRDKRATGFLPDGVELHEIKGHTSEEMQHIQQREFAIAEVSRLTRVPSNWLSLNVTTRVYTNSESERRDFLDFVTSSLTIPVEQRLSLAVPRGQTVKFNFDAFLRASTKERYESHAIGLASGFLTIPEVRELENRGPIGA